MQYINIEENKIVTQKTKKLFVGSINFQRPYLYKELVSTNTGQFLTATYDELALVIILSMGILFLPKVQATLSFTQMSGIRPNTGILTF